MIGQRGCRLHWTIGGVFVLLLSCGSSTTPSISVEDATKQKDVGLRKDETHHPEEDTDQVRDEIRADDSSDLPCEPGSIACDGNQELLCSADGMQLEPPVSCVVDEPCLVGKCAQGLGCVLEPTEGECEDSNPCSNSVCVNGVCTVDSFAAPGTPCPNGGCNGEGKCVEMECNDELDCGEDSHLLCVEGLCVECSVHEHCAVEDSCVEGICTVDAICYYSTIYPCCGNGIVEEDEECDDGNTIAGDGCSDVCEGESSCPDGTLALEGYCWTLMTEFVIGEHVCVTKGMLKPVGEDGYYHLDLPWNQALFDSLVEPLGFSSHDDPFKCCDGGDRPYLLCSLETTMCHTCKWWNEYSPGGIQGAPSNAEPICDTKFYPVFACLPPI